MNTKTKIRTLNVKRMKIVFVLGISMFMLWSTGCNLVNPAEKIPTYILIDSASVSATVSATHGSVSHKITDVWAYYNYELLGAYELPARVPVLAEGKGQLQLVAGIWDNGLSGTRTKYPFYNVDTFTFTADPTKSISHSPKFIYRTSDTAGVKYFWEGFEQGNIFSPLGGDTTFVKTNTKAEVFEGDWSGKMSLSTADPTGEAITTQEFFLTPNRDAYMELNYKSDVPFDIRTQIYQAGTTVTSDVMSFKAKDTWTKVYINLTGFAASFQYGRFKFIFKTALLNGQSNANLFIDNFKIIYYQ